MFETIKAFFSTAFFFTLIVGGCFAAIFGCFKFRQSAGRDRFNNLLTDWGDGDFSTFLLEPIKTLAWGIFSFAGVAVAFLGYLMMTDHRLMTDHRSNSSSGGEADSPGITRDYSGVNPNPPQSSYPSYSGDEGGLSGRPEVSTPKEGSVAELSTLSDCEGLDNFFQQNACRAKICQEESNINLKECEAFKKKVPVGGSPWMN